MNQRPGTALPSSPVSSFQRWRLQIFAITWLAYAAFYFTRKAFSVAKLGIAEDPGFQLDKMAISPPMPSASSPGACWPTASARASWCSAAC